MNEYAGIPIVGGRGSASIEQLRRALAYGKVKIGQYCKATNQRPPKYRV